MVGGYFNDLVLVLRELRRAIVKGGRVWTVVGDSRYAGVRIATAEILAELAPGLGLESSERRALPLDAHVGTAGRRL